MIGSLFSGIGGLELGLERAGLGPVVWQCEIDPYCRAVLARHWPDAERYTDVRDLRGAALPPVDLLCGGFPCQDVSDAGLRTGLTGARSGLWFEYARIVEETRPSVVVVENVRGLLGRSLDLVAGRLSELGYAVEASRIYAADVGAPHLRERVFIVGILANTDREGEPQSGRRIARRRGRPVDRGEVADPVRIRLQEPPHLEAPDQFEAPAGDGLGPLEPGLGGSADGLPSGLDGPGPRGSWPACRGEAQGEWEPPRVLERVAGRPSRLRAIGNAVSPQVAYVVGCRINERLLELGVR